MTLTCRLLRRAVALALLVLAGAGAAVAWGAAPVPAPADIYVGNTAVSAPPVVALPDGTSGTVVPKTTFGALGRPSGLARDPNGDIWVAYAKNDEILRYSPAANLATHPTATLSGTNTGLSEPEGITFNAAGHLWVTDAADHSVTEYAAGAVGNASPIAQLSGPATYLTAPKAVAIDAAGDVDVLDEPASQPGSLLQFGPGETRNAGPRSLAEGLFPGADGLALTSSGEAYIAEGASNKVVLVKPGSVVGATLAGPATRLSGPAGLAIDGHGHLWVANAGTNVITEYAAGASGNATPIATITATSLNQPGPMIVISAPSAETAGDTGVSQSSATLSGLIMPGGAPTTYHFEYGPTSAYGTSTPETSVGAGAGPREASVNLRTKAGETLHYRIVARNERGTAAGADAAFTTASTQEGALPMVYVSNDLPSHPEIDGYAPGARGDLPPTVRISGPSTRLVRPWGVALDTAGHLFVADPGAGDVFEYAAGANGNAAPIATIPGMSPAWVVADAAGHLLITDPNSPPGLSEYVNVNGIWVRQPPVQPAGPLIDIAYARDGGRFSIRSVVATSWSTPPAPAIPELVLFPGVVIAGTVRRAALPRQQHLQGRLTRLRSTLVGSTMGREE